MDRLATVLELASALTIAATIYLVVVLLLRLHQLGLRPYAWLVTELGIAALAHSAVDLPLRLFMRPDPALIAITVVWTVLALLWPIGVVWPAWRAVDRYAKAVRWGRAYVAAQSQPSDRQQGTGHDAR